MAKKNTFYGVVMSYANVSTYYPVNANHPNFDRFVFQQMIEDGSKADDDYTLIAYAVNADGTIINTVPLTSSAATPVTAKKKVQFANMKLDLTGLVILYPNAGVTSNLTINPTDFYGGGNYVYYTGSTQDAILLTVYTKIINPSPPA